MGRQPRERSGWQVVDESNEIGEVELAQRLLDSLVKLLPGESALDKG
jgi:hypothetical protein